MKKYFGSGMEKLLIDHFVVSDFEEEVNENLSQHILTTDSSEDTQHRVPEQSSEPASSRTHRVRRRSAWMSNYEVIGVSENFLTHFALFSYCDPTTFENVVKESKWRKAMDDEISAIEKKSNMGVNLAS